MKPTCRGELCSPAKRNKVFMSGGRTQFAPTARYWLLTFVVLIALVLLWPGECLVAECEGKRLFAWSIRTGEEFELTFTHSLNLSPITDVIEWTGSDLSVVKSVFKAFGAGVPVPADGIGTDIIYIDGHYELVGIDQHMQSVTILVQTVPNHQIAFRERKAYLLSLAGAGKSVTIAVRRVPLIFRLG